MAQVNYDLIVIGEGITGLTAANRAARQDLATATFEAELFGGLVININELEDSPDAVHASGVDLASSLMQANSELGVQSVNEKVVALAANGATPQVRTAGATYLARDAQGAIVTGGAVRRGYTGLIADAIKEAEAAAAGAARRVQGG